MLSKLRKPSDSEQGFTLIELLVVIIIIGILAAIAVPLFLDQRKLAVDASVKSDVRNTVTAITTAIAQDGTTDPTTVAATKTQSLGTNETVNVAKDSDGNYVVYGFDTDGKNINAQTSAFVFKSSTGQFITADASGFTAGGSTGGGGSAPAVAAVASASFEGSGDTITYADGRTGSSSISTAYATDGTHSLEMHTAANGYSGSFVNFYLPANTLVDGKTYTLSFDAKDLKDDGFGSQLNIVNQGNPDVNNRGGIVSPTTAGGNVSVQFVYSAGNDTIYIQQEEEPNTVLIDNMKVTAN